MLLLPNFQRSYSFSLLPILFWECKITSLYFHHQIFSVDFEKIICDWLQIFCISKNGGQR